MGTLLASGADVGAREKFGWTPLHSAALSGSAEIVGTLLGAGANAKARDQFGSIPFDFAKNNERLLGTKVYWLLNEARFQ